MGDVWVILEGILLMIEGYWMVYGEKIIELKSEWVKEWEWLKIIYFKWKDFDLEIKNYFI